MVVDELLLKEERRGVSASSIYSLSPAGRELADVLTEPTLAWADRYADLIERAERRRRE